MNRPPIIVTINKFKKENWKDWIELDVKMLSKQQSNPYYICEYVFNNTLEFQESSSLITNKIAQLFTACNNPNDYRIEFVVFYNNKAIVTMPCFYKTIMYNIKNNIDWLQRLIDAVKLSISYIEANNKENN